MKKNLIWIMALMVIASGAAWAHEGHDDADAKKTMAMGSASQSMTKSMYQCPMHKDMQSNKPGRCSKCGMKMKKVKVSDAAMPKKDKA